MALLQLHGLVPIDTVANMNARAHRLLRCDRIGALVTTLSEAFDLDDLDAEALTDWARGHHSILVAYCANGPVLPMAIGSVFSGEAAIRQVLALNQTEHLRTLGTLATVREYVVRLFLSDGPTPVAATPDSGRAFLRVRQAKRDDRRDLKERQRACARDLARQLQDLSVQHRPAPEAKPDRLLDDVVLIRKDTVTALQALAAATAEIASELSLRLEVTGPWPAYSFDPAHPPVPEHRHAG